jgi:hypothetical protein
LRRSHVIARSEATRQSSSFLCTHHLLQNIARYGDGIDADGFEELLFAGFFQVFQLADFEAEDRFVAILPRNSRKP